VEVDPDCIVLTPGASGAIQLALAALVDVGKGVLLPDPGYPCNRHFVELVSGEPQAVITRAAEGFRVTPEALAAAWRGNTVAAMLASPDNPTGQVLQRDELLALARVVDDRGGWLLMDEIYQGLCDDDLRQTVLDVAPDALVINSFSKYFGMTGWRLGWLVAPQPLIPSLKRLAQNFFLAPSTPAQFAALALFDEPVQQELLRRRDEFASRRQFCLEALARLGLPVMGNPGGAFYIYVDVSGVTQDSFVFCERLLEKAGVALTPGLDFGHGHEPEKYLRLALTVAVPRLAEAFSRLEALLS
jgi:aspartate/methionine/tyrosine aminotransferase